jgi:hypothetical protein
MKRKYMKARQGEILIFRNDNFRPWQKGIPVPENVIREGEKSGHKHEVKGDAQLAMFGDQMVIEVGPKGGEIVHPEHEPIKLEPGKYEVKEQREFDGVKPRKTKD